MSDKNYFLINQCANGWIVRKNQWGMLSEADMMTSFVYNSMSEVADHICADAGQPKHSAAKTPLNSSKPLCRCGKPCAHYGEKGGYSVQCPDCNARHAAQSRASRARRKAERSHT